MELTVRLVLCACIILSISLNVQGEEEEDPVKAPSLCEVCKFLVTELDLRLKDTSSKEVLETGHGLEKKKKIKYQKSELRFIEALTDPHVCEKILEYNVHKEKKGSLRYAKGRSETMETLHGLVDKGVKVDLGIPYELWDKPSAEVTLMQKQCFKLVEDHEEMLEDWYFGNQDQSLMEYFCANMVLRKDDKDCLYEKEVPKIDDSSKSEGKVKGDSGDKKKVEL